MMFTPQIKCQQNNQHVDHNTNKTLIPDGIEEIFNRAVDSVKYKTKNNSSVVEKEKCVSEESESIINPSHATLPTMEYVYSDDSNSGISEEQVNPYSEYTVQDLSAMSVDMDDSHVNCTSLDDIAKQFKEVLLKSKQSSNSRWEFQYIDNSFNKLELTVNKVSPSNLILTVNTNVSNVSVKKLLDQLGNRLATKGWKSSIDKKDTSSLHAQAIYIK